MKNKEIEFRYDEEADVLYAIIERKEKPIYREISEGVVLRLDRETQKCIGFTIIDYKKRLRDGLLQSCPNILKFRLPTY